ncbi:MAG: Serine/threonine-protein kinase pkn1, partial [Planctomycetota bacterium]
MRGFAGVSGSRLQRSGLARAISPDVRFGPAMMLWLAAGACGIVSMGATARAGLRLERQADRLVIETDAGEPVAEYVFADPRIGRPSLRDLRTPAGCVVTRPCPPRPGIDPPDHPTMHPGAMLCFSDLSGHDPWRHKTAVRFVGFAEEPTTRDGGVTLTAVSEYLAAADDTPDAAVICREESAISIGDRDVAGARVRLIRWVAVLTAGPAGVTFGDVQEMGFGIRLAKELAPKWGGRYLASHGGRDEEQVFGRQAAWCDASGTVDCRPCGVLCVDGEGNPRQPFFHARDSGWLLMNHFGCQTYTGGDSGAVMVEPGATLRLSAVFVLHDGLPEDALAELAAGVGLAAAAPGGPGAAASATRPGRLVPPTVIEAHVAAFNRLDPEDVVG